MSDEHLNNFVCDLIWLINLANDVRISSEMRNEINQAVLFLYDQKNNFCTDECDLFLDQLRHRCDHLGQMRWENDVKNNNEPFYKGKPSAPGKYCYLILPDKGEPE